MLIRSPAIQLAIVHQADWIRFATLYFLDPHLLFFEKVVEKLIPDWNIIILIFSIAKGSIFPIAPVVNFIFVIVNDTKVSSSCDSLNFVAF